MQNIPCVRALNPSLYFKSVLFDRNRKMYARMFFFFPHSLTFTEYSDSFRC